MIMFKNGTTAGGAFRTYMKQKVLDTNLCILVCVFVCWQVPRCDGSGGSTACRGLGWVAEVSWFKEKTWEVLW